VAVGKKELENDPIMGTLGKVLDSVFIDRDNAAAAVESLHQVEERARQGLSIMIAPEGTRLDTTSVGPFKKGPFRMAMAVGIPIVPIVIRNAEIIAARNSTTMNPGTVDVAVFPPISVTDWTVETLGDRIAEVRQLYVDTLADWPVDELPDHDVYRKKGAPRKAVPRKAVKAAKAPPAKAAAKKAAPAKAAPAKKATPAKKTAAKKTAKAAQPKAVPRKATKAQPSTPRPKGRS
jgi:putative phosphoserine phosphatase/1-acylglycerol-3-phosphate O-acyltransferase